MTTTGGQVSSFNPDDPDVKDLAFDGTHLWTINTAGGLREFTTNGTLLRSKEGVLASGWGLTWQDGYLWASDPDEDLIYRIGLFDNISPDSVKAWIDYGTDIVLLDVREQNEFDSQGRIPGTILMPWNSGVLDTAYVHLSPFDTVVVYCGSGYRSALASGFLGSKGFQYVFNMVGGFNTWHYSVEAGGHVSMSTTWSSNKSPYLAVEDVIIDSLITLTMQAGVSVEFGDSLALRVEGTWSAQGSGSNPVTITRRGSTGSFSIAIHGTINANHVDFEYFDSSGVIIDPGATIEKLNHVSFLTDDISGPNSLLQLTPTDDTLQALTFNGGTPGEDCNILLHGAGTLTIYGYAGDFGGPDYDCPGAGEIVWLQAIPGDANGDWNVDPGDVVYLLNYLFRNGGAPVPLEAGDCNGDGEVGPGDVVYLLNYLFRDGPPPLF
jgi:rhodanese-related sulfurtransferase